MKKKILLVVVFIFLILGITNTKILAVSESQIRNMTSNEQFSLLMSNIDNTHEYYFNANNLNQKQKELYRVLVNHFKESIDNYKASPVWQNKISTELTSEQIEEALVTFLYDYKVFFWLKGDLRYDISKIPSLDQVTYTFHFAILEIYQNETTFKKDLQEIVIKLEKIKNLVEQQKNTYSKIKVIHDWLLEYNSYAEIGKPDAAPIDVKEARHTPIGVFLDRYDPVCEAYAEGFLMIANYVNIKAVYGTGRATSQLKTEDHAWNYVWVYDKYYFLDVTWDKPINSSTYNYNYFLTDFPSTHIKDPKEVLPTPFTTSRYDATMLAEFDVSTSYYYEKTGSPIVGYENITITGAPIQQTSIEYYKKDGTKLSGAPIDLGVYYFVATPKEPTSLTGDIVVYFEIVPLMHDVTFIDVDTNEVVGTCKVYDGHDAVILESTTNGRKYVPQGDNYKNVTSDQTVYVKLERIIITFVNSNNEEVSVTLFDTIPSEIISHNFDFINENPEKIFVGWTQNDELIKEDTLLVSDALLHPLIEDIKFTIKGAIKGLDGYYRIKSDDYKLEEITLVSPNQKILEVIVSEVDDKGLYTIKLKVGSNYSTQERVVEIPMKQSSMLPFDLEMNQLIFYGVIALIAIIGISIIGSFIKSRRNN